jgi:hypothetical protein
MSYPPAGPPAPPPVAVPPPRSKAPRTLGIVSLVLGALVSLQSLVGALAGQALGMSMLRMPMIERVYGPGTIERYMERIGPATRLQSAIFLVLSLGLLLVGLGQLGYRAWARRWSVVWGVGALVALIPVAVIMVTVLGPAQAELMRSVAHRMGGPDMSAMGVMSTVMSLFFYAPYPIILIVVFRRPGIAAVMTE